MQEIFETIFERAKKYCRDELDLRHMETARQLAQEIISKEGGNEKVIIPAIILHDTG